MKCPRDFRVSTKAHNGKAENGKHQAHSSLRRLAVPCGWTEV